MTRLAITSTIIGVASIAGRMPGIIAPEKFGECARKFPRSVLWGRILMGVVRRVGGNCDVQCGDGRLGMGQAAGRDRRADCLLSW